MIMKIVTGQKYEDMILILYLILVLLILDTITINFLSFKLSYVDTLLNDTGLDNVGELRAAMIYRDTWRRLTDLRRVGARPK